MEVWKLFSDIIESGSNSYTTSGDDVQWKMEVIDNSPYLIFQGSRSKRDWMNNFTFWHKIYKNSVYHMRCHAGFAKAWKSCNDEVMSKFIDFCSEYVDSEHMWQPYIIGHSYGGALAVLAAEDFCFRTGVKPVLITFGAPKVLWGKRTLKHVQCYLEKVFQFAEHNDFVPYCAPLFGYKRVSKTLIGEKFNLFKMFSQTPEYHQRYGNEKDYANVLS